jgi:hypothetical protein
MQAKFNKTYREVDTVDVLSVIGVFLGTAVISGLATVTFAGFDFSSVAHTFGTSTEIQWAMAIPLIAYVMAMATNGFKSGDLSKYNGQEKVAFAVGLGGLLLFVLSPDLVTFVEGSTLAQVAYTGLSTASVLAIAAN